MLVMVSGFRHLKHLGLHEQVESLTEDGELTGAGFGVFSGSPLCETLQSISVDLWDYKDELIPLRDFNIAGMIAGIASCHNLRNINLMHSSLCDDAGLVVLGAGCPLLEEINLTLGPVTVDGLVDLAEHCKHLAKVIVNYDINEGRDFEAAVDAYFMNTFPYDIRPLRDRALVVTATLISRLPHICFECGGGWDEMSDDDNTKIINRYCSYISSI